jgi:hypothetical protein
VSDVITYPLRGITTEDGENLTQPRAGFLSREEGHLAQSPTLRSKDPAQMPPNEISIDPNSEIRESTDVLHPNPVALTRGGFTQTQLWDARNETKSGIGKEGSQVRAMTEAFQKRETNSAEPAASLSDLSFNWWKHMFAQHATDPSGVAQSTPTGCTSAELPQPSLKSDSDASSDGLLTEVAQIMEVDGDDDEDVLEASDAYREFEEEADAASDEVQVLITPVEYDELEAEFNKKGSASDTSMRSASFKELASGSADKNDQAPDVDAFLRLSSIPVLTQTTNRDEEAAKEIALAAFASLRAAQSVCMRVAAKYGRMESEQKMYLSSRGLYRTKR